MMRDLVPIGRFAHLSGCTVKALRFYDKLGIVRPAVVELATGFRYYRPSQVTEAQQVRLLRSLEMPLSEIRVLLTTEDPAVIHAVLARQRARLAEHISRQQRAVLLLDDLDATWTHRKGGNDMMPQEQDDLQHARTGYGCSFCGKDHAHVRRLIAGPKGVFICNECVAQCNEILAKEERTA